MCPEKEFWKILKLHNLGEHHDLHKHISWCIWELAAFKWLEETSQFNKEFIKSYSNDSHKGYFHQVDIHCTENLHNVPNDLPSLPERMKIEKVEILVVNLHDKEKCTHKYLNQALNHGLILKKVHRAVKFKQKTWLKIYIGMNTELRKKAKNDLKKCFLLMNKFEIKLMNKFLKNHGEC